MNALAASSVNRFGTQTPPLSKYFQTKTLVLFWCQGGEALPPAMSRPLPIQGATPQGERMQR